MPPARWAVAAKIVIYAFVALTVPLQLYAFLLRFDAGRAFLASASASLRYVYAHAGDIAGILFAFVVAPLIGLYFAFKAMVDLGDAIDLKVQQWRAERFRRRGW